MDIDSILERIGKVGGFAVEAMSAMAVAFKEAIERADSDGYKRGFADGERAAREELTALRKQLRAILGETDATRLGRKEIAQLEAPWRAPRGSVAPAVINALKSSHRGMTPKQVADAANIPENSARGSLNKLRHDGRVEKRGSLWFLSKNEKAA